MSGFAEPPLTAHYMMGGLCFRPDASTELPGLYAAGEDTGGVHGANRLGGNGVANSTVFGGIAGRTMAADVRAGAEFQVPDEDAIAQAVCRARRPVGKPKGNLTDLRETLLETMWDKVGIFRNEKDLRSALSDLDDLAERLDGCGIGGGSLAFHPTWHDWLNLGNLIAVSRAIATAALERDDSAGAHWRQDHPASALPADAAFVWLRNASGGLLAGRQSVAFSRVSPGKSLLGALS